MAYLDFGDSGVQAIDHFQLHSNISTFFLDFAYCCVCRLEKRCKEFENLCELSLHCDDLWISTFDLRRDIGSYHIAQVFQICMVKISDFVSWRKLKVDYSNLQSVQRRTTITVNSLHASDQTTLVYQSALMVRCTLATMRLVFLVSLGLGECCSIRTCSSLLIWIFMDAVISGPGHLCSYTMIERYSFETPCQDIVWCPVCTGRCMRSVLSKGKGISVEIFIFSI